MLANAPVAQAAHTLARFSPGLCGLLANHPPIIRHVLLDAGFSTPLTRLRLGERFDYFSQDREDPPPLERTLRLVRAEALAVIAIRDLTGRAGLSEVTGSLSALAEFALSKALEEATARTEARFSIPAGQLPFAPVVLGMGKLGARELNYSSDIDLIYLYRPRSGAAGAPEPAADFLFSQLTRLLSQLTPEGLVFRVDLDLRPGGKDGAMSQTLDSALNHYLVLGQSWERMALLKARPVAGDLAAGRGLIEALSPFVFRRHLDYTAIEELKELKKRLTRERGVKVSRLNSRLKKNSINVKLSPGGIREVEFFAQSMVITFGGRLPHLRIGRTSRALWALAEENIISLADARVMNEALTFLRDVEHRLQLVELSQTQTLPVDEAALSDLAAAMDFSSSQAFLAELKAHMGRVNERYALLLAEPSGPLPVAAAAGERDRMGLVHQLLAGLDDKETAQALARAIGFSEPETALNQVRSIAAQRYLPTRLARYHSSIERLAPHLIAAAAATLKPDQALSHMERFLTKIGPMGGFFTLIEENPNLIDLLAALFGTSEYLSQILISHPLILDSLIDRRSAKRDKSRRDLAADLATALAGERDPEEIISLIRRFKNDEVLRLGLFDILGQVKGGSIRLQLTALAEVTAEAVMETARQLTPGGRELDLAVAGMGSLGARELSYRSDLDLIFILGGASQEELVQAIKLVQRFISYISIPLPEGPGYQVDSRLRPSGTQGPLVTDAAHFRRYHQKSDFWERQALLRLRPLMGSEKLTRRIRQAVVQAVHHWALPSDLAQRIDSLRTRMSRERARLQEGMVNLKFSPGGLVDIEFITQYLQLIHAPRLRGRIRSASTLTALAGLNQHHLGPRGLEKLPQALELISTFNRRLGLIHARGGDAAAYTWGEIAALNLPGTPPDPAARLEEALDLAHDLYHQTFGPHEE